MASGIGGTGVVTIGALMGMGAHLEDKACSVFDMTRLSQKNGAVFSHVRIADRVEGLAHRSWAWVMPTSRAASTRGGAGQ